MSAALTPKQARFVQEYLVDLNAAQAAIRTGYSARTAKHIGAENLRKPTIQAAVTEAMKQRGARTEAKADDVLREITRLAMFDPGELTAVNDPEDIKALPEDLRRAIVGWGWDRQGNFVIKLAKEKALEMLGRHFGLFNDKIEHSGKVGVVGLAERMRQRGDRADRIADLLELARSRRDEALEQADLEQPLEQADLEQPREPRAIGLAERMRARGAQTA